MSARAVVVQHDKHWPYLTTRETLAYAAELYEVANKTDIATVVDEIIEKMGLGVCADTRCARLSGGQRRRLSIAVALLKQPTVLFLDEPTSGLDAAAASNIMEEIIRVAKEENLVIVCTIHQPSSKVYNGFDEVMIMSKGREAFSGPVGDAVPYFEEIGHPLPPATNPAEHFLDLVNSDFSSEEDVNNILDTWAERKPGGNNSSHHGDKKALDDGDNEGAEGVVDPTSRSLSNEIGIMFRRHTTLVVRDPVLYLGRCLIFLVSNIIFGVVYWNARKNTQDQAVNKMWITIWFVGVPSNSESFVSFRSDWTERPMCSIVFVLSYVCVLVRECVCVYTQIRGLNVDSSPIIASFCVSTVGVVAVYSLNDEFKSIMREAKNGMVSAPSYILAKTILVISIMFIFALFALGIPSFLIQDVPGSAFGTSVILWAVLIYVFECASEALAVSFDDPILGMLQFMNLWFASFLFGGFLIPLRDMFWPFKLFYYVMPYSYFIRSMIYSTFNAITFEPCTEASGGFGAVCIPETDGIAVLGELSRVFPLLDTKNRFVEDVGILLAIALFYKLVSIVMIITKSRKVADIK